MGGYYWGWQCMDVHILYMHTHQHGPMLVITANYLVELDGSSRCPSSKYVVSIYHPGSGLELSGLRY